MSNKIEEIKRVLKGGSRATKYAVYFSIPTQIDQLMELQDLNCLAKTTSFPSMSIGQIETWIQGRKLPIPGDTQYTTTWNVDLYVDNAHKVRKQMVAWMKAIDNFQSNTHSGVPAELFVEMSVVQLDSLEKPVAVYTFKDVWPMEVGEISVGADQIDTLQEFPLTFSFSSWIIEGTGGSQYNSPNDGRSASTNVTSQDQ